VLVLYLSQAAFLDEGGVVAATVKRALDLKVMYIYIYIYKFICHVLCIYIYMCVCACVCVWRFDRDGQPCDRPQGVVYLNIHIYIYIYVYIYIYAAFLDEGGVVAATVKRALNVKVIYLYN